MGMSTWFQDYCKLGGGTFTNGKTVQTKKKQKTFFSKDFFLIKQDKSNCDLLNANNKKIY